MELTELKKDIEQLKMDIALGLNGISAEIKMLHQDIASRSEINNKEMSSIKERIEKNEEKHEKQEKKIQILEDENLKLKTTINNVKVIGSVITFLFACVGFIFQFLV